MTLQGPGKHHARHSVKRTEDHDSIILPRPAEGVCVGGCRVGSSADAALRIQLEAGGLERTLQLRHAC